MATKSKPIQEQFGQVIIDAVVSFAGSDIELPSQIEAQHLSHVGDPALRQRLSEVWYGARWIYKLGLALLVRDLEQMAHVRAQVMDYAAVCEGILLDMIDHGMSKGLLKGKNWTFNDPATLKQAIKWNPKLQSTKLPRMPLYWFMKVALEEGIITSNCEKKLEWLREQRNKVHVRAGSTAAYLGTSMRAYEALHVLAIETRKWRKPNP